MGRVLVGMQYVLGIDTFPVLDGKTLAQYSWQEEFMYQGTASEDRKFSVETVLHETGHALGLPDYYDYAPTWSPNGGVGSMDLMGNCEVFTGDHNCLSKWALGPITPEIITDTTSHIRSSEARELS